MTNFDIIEYISGMTSYVFDKSMLVRIAVDRGVYEKTFEELTSKDKDLLKADLLYEAYLSPSIMASSSQSHGSYTNSVGSQQTYEVHRERLYNIFSSIYKKYDDAKLDELVSNEGTLQWLC